MPAFKPGVIITHKMAETIGKFRFADAGYAAVISIMLTADNRETFFEDTWLNKIFIPSQAKGFNFTAGHFIEKIKNFFHIGINENAAVWLGSMQACLFEKAVWPGNTITLGIKNQQLITFQSFRRLQDILIVIIFDFQKEAVFTHPHGLLKGIVFLMFEPLIQAVNRFHITAKGI